MLHFLMNQKFTKERTARTALNWFAVYGAALHRVSDREFILLIPLYKPHKIAAVKKQLERNAMGNEFHLVDVQSFIGGPQYTRVDETAVAELIESETFVKTPEREAKPEYPLNFGGRAA